MFYKEIKYGVMCDHCQKRLLGYDGLESYQIIKIT